MENPKVEPTVTTRENGTKLTLVTNKCDVRVTRVPKGEVTFRDEAEDDEIAGDSLPVFGAEVRNVLYQSQALLRRHICHQPEVQNADLACPCPPKETPLQASKVERETHNSSPRPNSLCQKTNPQPTIHA